MKISILLATLITCTSAYSQSKLILSCETSKQEVHSIQIEVNYPTTNINDMFIIKKEYKTYGSKPKVTRHDLNSIGSVRKFTSKGSCQFGSNEDIVLVVLINKKEQDRRKAPEFFICYEG